MIIIKNLAWDTTSFVRPFIRGGKPFFRMGVDNSKTFNVRTGAVALFLR